MARWLLKTRRSFPYYLALAFLLLPYGLQAQTYTVSTTSGGTGTGSLGSALTSAAGAPSATNSIDFSISSSSTIDLSASYPTVTLNSAGSLNITGTGQTVNGGGSNTIFNFNGTGTYSVTDVNLTDGTISVADGTLLTLSNLTESADMSGGASGTVATSGTVKLSGSGAFGNLTIDSGSTATLGANTQAVGVLTTTGTGILDLDGSTLSAGNLAGNGTITDSGADTTLTVNGTATSTFSGTLTDGIGGSNVLSLTLSGTGTQILSGTNTYTGDTTVNSGTLEITGSLASSPVVLTGGDLFLNGGSVNNIVVVTGGNLSLASGGVLAGTLDLGSDLTVDDGGLGSTGTISSVISGSGSITYDPTDSGTLVLSNSSNSYTGGTNINGGTLSISNAGDLGAGVVILNGGTLLTTANMAITQAVDLSAAGGIDVANADTILEGTLSGTGTLTKSGTGYLLLEGSTMYTGNTVLAGGTLDFAQSTNITYGGNISGSGALEVGMGANTLTLTGTNNYTGTTTLDNGTLSISAASNLGSGNLFFNGGTLETTASMTLSNSMSGSGSFNVAAGGTTLTGNLSSMTYLSMTGTGILSLAGSTLNSGNISVETGTLDLDNTVNLTYGGDITGTGSLSKSGTSTLTLTGTNNYTGTTTLNGGTLSIGAADNLGSGALNFNGGTLETTAGMALANSMSGSGSFGVRTGTTSLTGNISGMTGLTMTGSGTLALAGTTMYTGNTEISNGTLDFAQTTGITYGGNISGPGAVQVDMGAHTLALSGNNSYLGGTLLNSGTLALGNSNALGQGAVTMETGTTLQAGAANLAVTNVVGLNGNDTFDSNGNSWALSGVIGGTGSLAVTSSAAGGALTLSGDNSYSGGTSLQSGLLNVGNNNALGTGGLVMAGGTTLQAGSGVDAINNALTLNGQCTFDLNSAGLVLGVISGTGSLAVTNSGSGGAFFVNQENTYSGGTDINAVVCVEGNGTLGTGPVTNYGILAFWLSATAGNLTIVNDAHGGENGIYFQGGPDSGTQVESAGTATITNNGFLAFQNYSTADEADIINNGTLQFEQTALGGTASILNNAGGVFDISDETNSAVTVGSIGGAGTFYLGKNGLVTGSSGLSTTISGDILDGGVDGGTGGSLTKMGTGTLTLSGNNSYSGGTTLAAGTLALGSNSALGTGNLVMSDGTTLQAAVNDLAVTNAIVLDGADTYDTNNKVSDLSGVLSGSGSLAVTDSSGDGAVTLSGDNTYSGGTLVSAGFVAVDTNGTLGNGAATVGVDGSLAYIDSANAGSISILNNGVLAFEDNASAGSASISNGGDLFFFESAQGGTAAIQNGADAILDISQSSAAAVTVGSLSGAGTVALGSNDLAVGSSNASTTFLGDIADGSEIFDSSATGGSLTKIGTGTLTLAGDSSYSGGTTVAGGTLVAANTNAFGTGSVVVNAGTLALSGPLTLNIGGGYTQGPGGTLQVGLGPTSGNWDNLNVSGAATLAGTLKLVSYSGFEIHDMETFTILNASGVTGTFSTVTDSVGGNGVSVIYNPTDVILEALPNAPSFEALGTTTNEKNLGAALDSQAGHGNNSTLITYLNAQSNASIPGILNQMSPANLTPLYQMSFASSQAQAGMVGSRLEDLFHTGGPNALAFGQCPLFAGDMPASEEAAMAPDTASGRWSAFADGMGNFGKVSTDGNGPGYQYSTGGTTAGLDYRFSKDLAGGLLLGYSSSGTSDSTGTVNMTGGQLGLYAGWKQDAFHVTALAEGGLNSYTTLRTALGGTASGSTQGQQYSGSLSAGYDLTVDRAKVVPFVSGQYTHVYVNGFAETGSMAPLSFGAQSEGYLSSDLGATASRSWKVGGLTFSPQVSAAWEHVYQGNLDSLSASLAGPNGGFTAYGPATGQDAAVLGAGVDARFAKGLDVYARYQGKVGLVNYAEQDLSAGVDVGF